MSRVALKALAFAAVVAGCGATPRAPATPEAPAATALDRFSSETDYVAIGPRALLAAMEPLLAHRESHGHVVARWPIEEILARRGGKSSDAEAVAASIRGLAAKAGPRLHDVLLVGDVPAPGEAVTGFTPVPTFYLPKLNYELHDPGAHAHPPLPFQLGDHDHSASHSGELYPSDYPYALANGPPPGARGPSAARTPEPLAVGRVPARTPEEARDFAAKIVLYETSAGEGAWRRRIEVIGGPANFGPLADGLLESTATRLLDTEVPYDYDVRVLFSKLGSAYAFPFPELERRVNADLDAGALFAAYVGHGAAQSFEDVHFHARWFEISTTGDALRLTIGHGQPLFLSIACNTGAFDLRDGERSLAEAMVLNPKGPIGVFAATRESHPYANALLGQGFVDAFIKARAPSIGDGILATKRAMHDADLPLATLFFDTDTDDLKDEHDGLYNLLGDPATVLRYPSRATLSVTGGLEAKARGAIDVTVNAEDPKRGAVTLTLETPRSVIRRELVSTEALEAMSDDDAWTAMRKNYDAASDKIVARAVAPLADGRATARIDLPEAPGDYELKALVLGDGTTAATHVRIHVVAR